VTEINPQSSEDESEVGETTLAILQHDSAWAWLLDPDEDVYSEADIQPEPGA
jgi:hypothetical protein